MPTVEKIRELERDRERYMTSAYGFFGIPKSNSHEDILLAIKGKDNCTTEQRDGSSDDDGSQAAQTSTSAPDALPEISNKMKTRPNASAKLSGKNTGKSRTATDDGISSLAPNEMKVELVFDSAGSHEQKYRSSALLDTGADDDWMSEKLVEELKLSRGEDPGRNEQLIDFNGQPLISRGTVDAHWRYGNYYWAVVFRIAADCPRDIIFGYKTLFKRGIMKLNPHVISKPAAVLVKEKATPTKSEAKSIGKRRLEVKEEASAIEQYREWRGKMFKDGWEFDANTKKFGRIVDGTKEWCPIPISLHSATIS